MNKDTPVVITVAPNGARKTSDDHTALPLTPEDIAITAQHCFEAGARMIHLHVRDKNQGHLLDAGAYQLAIDAIHKRLGRSMIIQPTTEAVGIYKPDQQMAVVRALKPEAVSLAIRELCPKETHETAAADFFGWIAKEKISPQFILYGVADILRLKDLRKRGVIPDGPANVLLVLGRYSVGQQSMPDDLLPLYDVIADENLHWAVCAFGSKEAECALFAISKGGHVRVGFENNMLLSNGELAGGNEDLVSQITGSLDQSGRVLASTDQARELMGVVR
jgi:3-keto-5-aminohexanoate cleavage enzyme